MIICFFFSKHPFMSSLSCSLCSYSRPVVEALVELYSFGNKLLYVFMFLNFKSVHTCRSKKPQLNMPLVPVCFSLFFILSVSQTSTVRAVFMRFMWFPFGVFHFFRLAGQTASRAVSLFLDGDVSFLPDNSFPSHIQLLKVCDWVNCNSNIASSYLVNTTNS